jgi:hypothetical protein
MVETTTCVLQCDIRGSKLRTNSRTYRYRTTSGGEERSPATIRTLHAYVRENSDSWLGREGLSKVVHRVALIVSVYNIKAPRCLDLYAR